MVQPLLRFNTFCCAKLSKRVNNWKKNVLQVRFQSLYFFYYQYFHTNICISFKELTLWILYHIVVFSQCIIFPYFLKMRLIVFRPVRIERDLEVPRGRSGRGAPPPVCSRETFWWQSRRKQACCIWVFVFCSLNTSSSRRKRTSSRLDIFYLILKLHTCDEEVTVNTVYCFRHFSNMFQGCCWKVDCMDLISLLDNCSG